MYLYIEFWMPRRAWSELAEAEQRRLVAEQGDGASRFVSLIRNDGQLDLPSGCAYVAVWELPDEEELQAYDHLLGAGWHDYFGEVVARGTSRSPREVLGTPVRRLPTNGRH